MQPATKTLTAARERLFDHFSDVIEISPLLNRQVVSFQANKNEPVYRLFKYKEGFASRLVSGLISAFAPKPGLLLDPFAGSGTALFAGRELGWKTTGIEILPVGAAAILARQALERVSRSKLKNEITKLRRHLPDLWSDYVHFKHIRITEAAFPEETEGRLNGLIEYTKRISDPDVQRVIAFVGMSVLEQISFTRKDGQYLRWDYRSSRNRGNRLFSKGRIYTLQEAIDEKLRDLELDLVLLPPNQNSAHLSLLVGSSLDELPKLRRRSIDLVITSPPYCNRYDYTRTYALELVYLGLGDDEIKQLRQSMLSCTVENKEKVAHLRSLYNANRRTETFDHTLDVYGDSRAMSEVNSVLEQLCNDNRLNNDNVPRMVRNYFLEMCFVIGELSRIVKPGGRCIMVNDNVRYGGEEIPVDLILSEFAEKFGFRIEHIMVLPRGKGNSSQQMGNFGRTEIRKCVYVWRKE